MADNFLEDFQTTVKVLKGEKSSQLQKDIYGNCQFLQFSQDPVKHQAWILIYLS